MLKEIKYEDRGSYFKSDAWVDLPELANLFATKVLMNEALGELAIFFDQSETVQVYELKKITIDNLTISAKLSNFDYIWRHIESIQKIVIDMYNPYIKFLVQKVQDIDKEFLFSYHNSEILDLYIEEKQEESGHIDPDLFPALALFAAETVRASTGGVIEFDSSRGIRGPVVVDKHDQTIDCYSDILRHVFNGNSSYWSFSEYIRTLSKNGFSEG